MRILRNILYVLTPGAYLALDGENVVLQKEGEELRRYRCTIWKGSWPSVIPGPAPL